MHITFLLGPAGAGKTYRCLQEVRQELKRSPEGLPLLFLTPRQATYQIERELLSDPELPGFTRLQVLGFAALAELIVHESASTPQVLSDLGRVMVLRALLTEEHNTLQTFHASARMQGFAQQLSDVLNELQQARLSPELIRLAATRECVSIDLHDKLLDLARLLERYTDWLRRNNLYDPRRLLMAAVDAIDDAKPEQPVRFGAIWLDGFAELTEDELALLAALAPCSERVTLAFCVDRAATGTDAPWHSIWNNVSRTVNRCFARMKELPGGQVSILQIDRRRQETRFSDAGLAHLESNWATGQPFRPATEDGMLPLFPVAPPVKILKCRNPAEEAAACAREILAFVRTSSHRFRDVAILLRTLNGYQDALARALARYEIPFFIDRREPVAHHPLAELIRYALRLPLEGWSLPDWCGALKTGLLLENETAVDEIETQALAHGWNGETWLQPFTGSMELYRSKFVPPFEQFAAALHKPTTGPALVKAFRALIAALPVVQKLQRWSEEPNDSTDRHALVRAEIHHAVWGAIDEWFDAVELAFENSALSIGDWLPIVEAGLANLTVGVIPPALDQVLIGTVDRSRNPDLKVAVVMGLNETIFPAPPPTPALLSEYDRDVLRQCNVTLGHTPQELLGLEQYLAYIACTRARERLVLTFSERGVADQPLNPSSIIDHVKDIFPQVIEQTPQFDWRRDAVHPSDLIVPLLKNEWKLERAEMAAFGSVLERFENHRAIRSQTALSPDVARQLYGPEVEVSVSQLEDFAACQFRFFLKRGLHTRERREFKVDNRLSGIFQHEVLQRFHRELASQGKRWRDIDANTAKSLVRRIGAEVRQSLQGGIFNAAPEWRFAAETLIQRLERFIVVIIGWAPQYQFDPQAVELGFGGRDNPLPPWRIDLGNGYFLVLTGRIDRVDIHSEGSSGYVVIVDYKVSGQDVDNVRLAHGLDLQLVAYLAALRNVPQARALLDCAELIPAGGFYVPLRNTNGSAKTREEALHPGPQLYQHSGRFRGDLLDRFDNRGKDKGDQFNYRLTKSEEFYKNCKEPMDRLEFEALISETEYLVRDFGRAIFAGAVGIEPFRYKKETACSRCDYAAVCRFDAWTQPFRVLRPKEG